jgi:hypothetical protein
MAWMPIAAQAQNEERSAVVTDGVWIRETGRVEPQNVPTAGELSTWSHPSDPRSCKPSAASTSSAYYVLKAHGV